MGAVGTSATSRPQECGCSLIPDARIRRLASRAVATPFVGALAAALVLAEIIRPLHGGGVHSTLDLQMKNLRHRAGAAPHTHGDRLPPRFVAALLH